MTRDEAIKVLEEDIEWAKLDRHPYIDKNKVDALNIAIKALEQQTCEDAVSRQAVLGLFAQNADAIRPYSKTWEEVKALSPVKPQPKTGHWKKMVEVYDLQQNRMLVPYGYDDAKFGNTPVYVCDCGCESNKNSRFCPDCGCRMVDK